jgi:hypothetical protein
MTDHNTKVLEEKIVKHMVERFLSWRLPDDFQPDCGISFQKDNGNTAHLHKYEPVGTNLFTASQAEGMVRYILEGFDLSQARQEGYVRGLDKSIETIKEYRIYDWSDEQAIYNQLEEICERISSLASEIECKKD